MFLLLSIITHGHLCSFDTKQNKRNYDKVKSNFIAAKEVKIVSNRTIMVC